MVRRMMMIWLSWEDQLLNRHLSSLDIPFLQYQNIEIFVCRDRLVLAAGECAAHVLASPRIPTTHKWLKQGQIDAPDTALFLTTTTPVSKPEVMSAKSLPGLPARHGVCMQHLLITHI